MLNATLLIIDDEPAQLQALAGFLKKRGYKVEKLNRGWLVSKF